MTDEPKLNLEWLRQHVPIFAKMEQETKQRRESETFYKTLLPKLPTSS